MRAPLVVVGDVLLDVDVAGRVERTCPDAPALVVDEECRRDRPGGAGLAATLAAADGVDVVLVAPLADDEAGQRLRELLAGMVRLIPLPYSGSTPVKTRVRCGDQTLLRLDSGGRAGTVGEPDEELHRLLQRAGAVLVSDYGRGTTTSEPLRRQLAGTPRGVPLVWDPHPRGGVPLSNARIVTPNTAEAQLFARRCGAETSDLEGDGLRTASVCASTLVREWKVGAVAVTRGARGALLSYGDDQQPLVVPAPTVRATDPCGAGDRFAATVAMLLGAGAVTREAFATAVHSAADFVAAGGAAGFGRRLDAGDTALRMQPAAEAARGPESSPAGPSAADVVAAVRAAGGTVVATGGCFDLLHAGHVATLRAARELGDCLVVCLNSDDSVRRLKGPSRPVVPAHDRARVLEALEYVDAVVVFDEDTPQRVLEEIRPDVWAKGGDYAVERMPEVAVLRQWGGQAVILPYVAGRSTTHLVRTAQQAELQTRHGGAHG